MVEYSVRVVVVVEEEGDFSLLGTGSVFIFCREGGVCFVW